MIEYLKTENEILKSQLKGRRLRLTDDQRRRLATKGRALGRKVPDRGRLHRDARHHSGVASPLDGRERIKEHGIDPAPTRGQRISWATFMKAHWPNLAAIDFTTVE